MNEILYSLPWGRSSMIIGSSEDMGGDLWPDYFLPTSYLFPTEKANTEFQDSTDTSKGPSLQSRELLGLPFCLWLFLSATNFPNFPMTCSS